MGVRSRVDSIDRDVKLIVDELLSPAARSRLLAEGAKAILDEADEMNRQVLGRIPGSTTYVDGRAGGKLSDVNPKGVIVREYQLVQDVLIYIGEQLRVTSPVGKKADARPGHPGFYKASHTLFADGVEIAEGGEIPDAKEYVFLSTAPYARKVEKRHTVYEMVAAKASRRFGNIARVYFGWRSPLQGYVAGGATRAGRAAERRMPAKQAAKRLERASRVPAIIVDMGR